MDGSVTPCDFPPCSRSAVVALRLLVDGAEAVMRTCRPHADWLRTFAQADPGTFLDQVSEGSRPPLAPRAADDLA